MEYRRKEESRWELDLPALLPKACWLTAQRSLRGSAMVVGSPHLGSPSIAGELARHLQFALSSLLAVMGGRCFAGYPYPRRGEL